MDSRAASTSKQGAALASAESGSEIQNKGPNADEPEENQEEEEQAEESNPSDVREVRKLLAYSINFARYFQFSEADQKTLNFSSYYDKDYVDTEEKPKHDVEFPNYTRVTKVNPDYDPKIHRDDRQTTAIIKGRFCELEQRRGVPIRSSSCYGRQTIGPLEKHDRRNARRILITESKRNS